MFSKFKKKNLIGKMNYISVLIMLLLFVVEIVGFALFGFDNILSKIADLLFWGFFIVYAWTWFKVADYSKFYK